MRYTIYVKEEDQDVLEHIKAQKNSSEYLIELARQDRERQQQKEHTEKHEIKKIVYEVLEEMKNTP